MKESGDISSLSPSFPFGAKQISHKREGHVAWFSLDDWEGAGCLFWWSLRSLPVSWLWEVRILSLPENSGW